jgi:sulfonate transport system ATP-binding protein
MTAATVTARKSYSTTTPAYTPAPHGKVSFSFRNVTKHFGGKAVLQGINLDVHEGQFVAIIGKSGCGKSTLLRLLAGLDKPTSGEIVTGVPEADQKRTRIMFQEPRLLPWARVAANVDVGLTGIDKGQAARNKSLEILAEVGLADRGGEWLSVLSGGQRQRVALARALVGHPSILALDEPLGALDALTRIEMQQLLERIWLAKRFTAVLVTHDVTEAVSLADRVVVIDSGRIALDLTIPVERPRRHASPELAFFERQILDQLYNR